MRALLLVLVACGGSSPPQPVQNTAPRSTDPLVVLREGKQNMCACAEQPGPEVDETCSANAAKPIQVWIGDGEAWKRQLTDAQLTEAATLLVQIKRCFQVGIGDPVPPAH